LNLERTIWLALLTTAFMKF